MEIRDNLILIIQIFAITIAFALLTNLASSFQRENVTQLAQYACYTILTMLSINSFVLALELGKKNCDTNGGFYANNIAYTIKSVDNS